jgi:hypothetical protein
MRELRRTGQDGSITLVIIVGILLVLGLVGGIFLLKQRGAQVRRDQIIATVTQQTNVEAAENTDTASTSSGSTTTGNLRLTANANASSAVSIKNTKGDNLPETGPEVSILELFGVGILTAFTVKYFMSRKSSSRSL